LAAQKGQSETRFATFAKRIANDHAKAKQKLEKDRGSGGNIRLPEDLIEDAKQTYERLSKLSGPDFDRAYALDMVKDHKKVVADFKRSIGGKNGTIRRFRGRNTFPL